MSVQAGSPSNPLAKIARAFPDRLGWLIAVLARGIAVGLAIALAANEPYVRTRVFTIIVAVVIALTLLPAGGRWGQRLAWIGAGMAFFGGAPLWSFPVGQLILLCGVLAAAGAAIDDVHRRRMIGVSAFFTGAGLTALAIFLPFLAIWLLER